MANPFLSVYLQTVVFCFQIMYYSFKLIFIVQLIYFSICENCLDTLSWDGVHHNRSPKISGNIFFYLMIFHLEVGFSGMNQIC